MLKDALKLYQIPAESRWVYLGFFTAFAITVYVVESVLPKPVPFLKLGLANIVVLMLLWSGYPVYAICVSLLKTLLGGFLSGTFASPGTVLSLVGSLLSIAIMLVFRYRLFGFSIIGVSVLGAVGHNVGQLLAARMIVIRDDSIFYLTPIMLLLGIVTGILIGYLADLFLEILLKKVHYEDVGAIPKV